MGEEEEESLVLRRGDVKRGGESLTLRLVLPEEIVGLSVKLWGGRVVSEGRGGSQRFGLTGE